MKRDLAALAARDHDLLVVGSGIYGATVAWDAAQRGLGVALVERDDFGAGVSANSLKTIHGGLRHLQSADLGGLRESVRERRALLRIAPALVRPLGFLVPTRGHGVESRAVLGAGLAVYDLLSSDRNDGLPSEQQIPRGRLLSPEEVRGLVPGLPGQGLNGGALWHDAQVASGERLVVAFVRAAADAGALVANHAGAVAFLFDGRRVSGVRVRDGMTGEERAVRARMVVNTAGPDVDALVAFAGVSRPPASLLRARNVVFAQAPRTAVAVGARSRGRYLFLVPWNGRTMVGTAYEPAEATGRGRAVREFLAEAQAAFPWAGLEERALALVHEGRVPGGAEGLGRALRLHDHEAEDGIPGLVSVQGAKYTTARGVAERVVDLVLRRLGRAPVACRTAETPLSHARPLAGSPAERAAEAVRDEMALTLDDAVRRRLDLGTAGPPPPEELAPVEAAVAAHLGWDEPRRQAERAALARAYADPLLE